MVTLPLDKRDVHVKSEKGGTEKVPALDKRFLTDINFLQYNAFPIHEKNDSPIITEWHQEVKILSYDLEILLTLPHEKFWVQLIHDPTLHTMLSTFLQKAPRSWDLWSIPEKYNQSHLKLSKFVFLTLLRMSTDKESPDCFLSKEAFGFTIYENFMFDMPKIIDLCSLYGHPYGGNGMLVNKMLTNIFTKQISYVEDLKVVASQLTHNVIDNITSKYDKSLTTIGLYDLLCYYYDTCMSMICLFSTYPPTLNYFETSDVISSFVTLYGHLFHDIKTKLKHLSTPAHDLHSMKHVIHRGQVATVKLFHCIIWGSCQMDQLLDDKLSVDEHTRCAEQFIAMVSLLLGDAKVMTKYYHECNLPKTFSIIKSSKAEVGQDHFNYILNAIDIERDSKKDISDLDKVHYNSSKVHNGHAIAQTQSDGHTSSIDKKMTDLPPNIELLINSVKDIFPQYNNAFIQECLLYYECSGENVISALIGDNLPPHIEKLKSENSSDSSHDHNMVFTHDNVQETVKTSCTDSVQGSEILSSRQNIFDNDEFDVFNNPQELNLDRIHMGKRCQNDETQLEAGKIFLKNNPKFNFEYDEYEDEYDDTYDGLIAASDSTATTEPPEFVIKPLNEYHNSIDGDAAGSQIEEQTSENVPGPSTKSERPVNDEHYGHGRGNRRRQQNPRPRAEDKVGQKADGKVLQQRRRDNENKAARGNHNRKRGADKKRRGGMLHM